MHTITNFFIANLALADVTIGMFAIPFQFQAAILQRWNLPEFMCPFCPFVQAVSVNVSVFTLTAIAIDRHRGTFDSQVNFFCRYSLNFVQNFSYIKSAKGETFKIFVQNCDTSNMDIFVRFGLSNGLWS